ncbi:hypothetical protein PR048_033027 [Dryococelus australis]|uniref:EF-hand domain-containing protein n=1 Tax=Dryococelus australis TaxID=614101 RepID=A0ABQ9G704_9NEOP|nr:hypothetical protein PR048_033027 [Dryococelus australis]
MQGRGKREILEKIRQPTASSDTIPMCENLGAIPPGIEPGWHSTGSVCVQYWECVCVQYWECVCVQYWECVCVQYWECVCAVLGVCVQYWECVCVQYWECVCVQYWECVCSTGSVCAVLGVCVQFWECVCAVLGVCVQYSECAFQLMDHDKDGIINKNDLRATFDSLGRLASDKEMDDMVSEAPGPINFTQLLTLFANRMSGETSSGTIITCENTGVTRQGIDLVRSGSDDDDVVINAFKSFDDNGKIDSEKLRHALMTWGDKFSGDEVDDAFDQMVIDDKGYIDTAKLITMLTASAEDEEEEAAA